MRTKEVPLIPRAGSVAMGIFNSRVEKKADRQPRVVNVRKVLAKSGIVRGEVKRVKADPVKVKEEVCEPQPPKMTEMEWRMADYLQAAEKVVKPPEEAKEEETAEVFDLKAEREETAEVEEVKVPGRRKRRRRVKMTEENETTESKEEELTL